MNYFSLWSSSTPDHICYICGFSWLLGGKGHSSCLVLKCLLTLNVPVLKIFTFVRTLYLHLRNTRMFIYYRMKSVKQSRRCWQSLAPSTTSLTLAMESWKTQILIILENSSMLFTPTRRTWMLHHSTGRMWKLIT